MRPATVFLTAALALGALILQLPAPARAQSGECLGREVTERGTDGDDVLRGTPSIDVIAALGGDDVVIGRGDDDVLCGGNGRDVVRGGAGRDSMSGGGGPDRIDGGAGDDYVSFFHSRDPVRVDLSARSARGEGIDVVVSVIGVMGSVWDDVLLGDGRANSIGGGPCCADDHDTIRGRGGKDLLGGADGRDEIRGGDGRDRIYGDGSPSADADRIFGGAGGDLLVGDNAEEAGGADVIDGGSGNDKIIGDNQAVYGGEGGGGDVLAGGGGDDTVAGQEGDDTLRGGDGDDVLDGGPGADQCTGGETTTACEESDASARRWLPPAAPRRDGSGLVRNDHARTYPRRQASPRPFGLSSGARKPPHRAIGFRGPAS